MVTQKVVVTIPLDDTKPITAEAEGHTGRTCALDLDALVELMGGKADRTNKAEYFKEPKTRERLKA